MNKSLIFRILSWSIVVLFGLIFLTIISAVEEEITLAQGRIHLLAGDYKVSEELFREISSSVWHGESARMGLALNAILSGQGLQGVELDTETDVSRFHLSLLMMKTLRRGRTLSSRSLLC